MYNVLVRPLLEEDALVSCQWRNNPKVWVYTGRRPDKFIAPEVEIDWIKKVLAEKDSYRFAIIADDKYVGNIQITNVLEREEGEYHIFIGDENYWGKGIATLATYQLIRFAQERLNLKKLYLFVNPENKTAVRVYEKCGFKRVSDEIKMVYDLSQYLKPKVSVFMMVYNHELYIRQAIESILSQKTNFDFNLVIGEDCSTDNTRSVVLNLFDKYPGKFKLLLHNNNIGAFANQVAVLSACKGKYVALCEGDDYWIDPNKLQKQVDFLETNPAYGLCFGEFIAVNKDGKMIEKSSFYKGMPIQVKIDGYCFNEFLMGMFDIRPPSVIFRKELIQEEVKSWPKFAYDVWLFQRILFRTKIHKFNEVFAAYRSHDANLTSNDDFYETVEKATYDNLIFFSNKLDQSPTLEETKKILFRKSIGFALLSQLNIIKKTVLFINAIGLFPGFKVSYSIFRDWKARKHFKSKHIINSV